MGRKSRLFLGTAAILAADKSWRLCRKRAAGQRRTKQGRSISGARSVPCLPILLKTRKQTPLPMML